MLQQKTHIVSILPRLFQGPHVIAIFRYLIWVILLLRLILIFCCSVKVATYFAVTAISLQNVAFFTIFSCSRHK